MIKCCLVGMLTHPVTSSKKIFGKRARKTPVSLKLLGREALRGGVHAAILLSCETDSPMGQAHGGLYAEECDSY